MERKHTKGPWSSGSEYIGVGGTISGYIIHAGADNEYAVGLILGGSECEETKANAHLSAAAPDLLAACEAGLQELQTLAHSFGLENFDSNPAAKQLRAAIAKATGGAQ